MKPPAGKVLTVCLAGVLASGFFAAGHQYRGRDAKIRPPYHNMRVNHVPDLVSLVDPDDPTVRSLAVRLVTPEAAYSYVRDRIRYEPMLPAANPREILRAGAGSCLGKATLLCSLYRAMGIPAGNVRLIVGNVALGDRLTDHVWIDLEYGGGCLQQDPSGLLGVFEFGQFRGMDFTRYFVQEENYCFNDEGFAVISQLNRFRNGM
jgi:transglutaminase-like putative cysteine protease